jgi:hypothetical protein
MCRQLPIRCLFVLFPFSSLLLVCSVPLSLFFSNPLLLDDQELTGLELENVVRLQKYDPPHWRYARLRGAAEKYLPTQVFFFCRSVVVVVLLLSLSVVIRIPPLLFL